MRHANARNTVFALVLAACSLLAHAETGVTSSEILVGMSNAQTGPASGLGRKLKEGATAYFNRVNDAGGIHGRNRLMGNALLDLGVRPEQRVLCLLLDSPEFLGAFWGAIKIGAIPIPANTMLRADDYLYFLDDSRAPVAIVSEALLAEAGPALAKARYLRHVIVAGRASGPQIPFESWVAKASARSTVPTEPHSGPSVPACITILSTNPSSVFARACAAASSAAAFASSSARRSSNFALFSAVASVALPCGIR